MKAYLVTRPDGAGLSIRARSASEAIASARRRSSMRDLPLSARLIFAPRPNKDRS